MINHKSKIHTTSSSKILVIFQNSLLLLRFILFWPTGLLFLSLYKHNLCSLRGTLFYSIKLFQIFSQFLVDSGTLFPIFTSLSLVNLFFSIQVQRLLTYKTSINGSVGQQALNLDRKEQVRKQQTCENRVPKSTRN